MSHDDFVLLCISAAVMATITVVTLLGAWLWSEIRWRRWGRR